MTDNQDIQPLTEHLTELRNRLIWILLFFVGSLIVSFFFSVDIFLWIRNHTYIAKAIYTRSPGDPLKVYMQISFIFALLATMPVIMFHTWRFVSPGLSSKEQKATLIYIPVAIILFLLGLLFGIFAVFPAVIRFLYELNQQMGLQTLYNVYDAFSFLLGLVIPLALFFELPVVVLFLTRIGVFTPSWLQKNRRFAYLILVILSAVFAPPDLVSNILILAPLILLYEVSIWLSKWQYRRMQDRE